MLGTQNLNAADTANLDAAFAAWDKVLNAAQKAAMESEARSLAPEDTNGWGRWALRFAKGTGMAIIGVLAVLALIVFGLFALVVGVVVTPFWLLYRALT